MKKIKNCGLCRAIGHGDGKNGIYNIDRPGSPEVSQHLRKANYNHRPSSTVAVTTMPDAATQNH